MTGADADRPPHPLCTLEVAQRLGLWEWVPTTGQMVWSPGLYELHDLAPTTPPTLNHLLARLHPADRLAFETHLSSARRERGLLSFRCRSESERIVSVRMQRTLAADGSLRSIVGTNQDITDEVRAGAPEVVMASISSALTDEIESSLAVISTALGVQARTPAIDAATAAVGAISRVLADLELAVRGDRGDRTRLRLDHAVARAMAQLPGLATDAAVTTRFAETHAIEANPLALNRVLVELLDNALDGLEGTPRRELQISTRNEGVGWAVVEIVDRGVGIPATAQPRVLEPFFTTKGPGHRGLGLAVSRGIVEGLGGALTIHSQEGAGTRVIVALPTEPPARVAHPELAPATHRTRVMIVDDEVLFAKAISRLLAIEHEVVTVGNGKLALDEIRRGARFDVILSDLMMPVMTGAELRAELLELAPDQAERMIFITGGALDAASEAMLATVEYFEKPCDVAELREAVRRRCRRG